MGAVSLHGARGAAPGMGCRANGACCKVTPGGNYPRSGDRLISVCLHFTWLTSNWQLMYFCTHLCLCFSKLCKHS